MKDKKIISVLASFLLIGVIGSCQRSQAPEEVRPVDWWETNAQERAAKLKECETNPQKLDATPNCINASRAENNVKAATKWGTEKGGVRTEPTVLP
jgi:hypothetical protein